MTSHDFFEMWKKDIENHRSSPEFKELEKRWDNMHLRVHDCNEEGEEIDVWDLYGVKFSKMEVEFDEYGSVKKLVIPYDYHG